MQKEQNERFLARAALAAQAQAEFSGTIPSDTEMTDFIEGRVQGEQRERILAYLRTDPDACRDWQDTVDALAVLEPPVPESRTQPARAAPGWKERFREIAGNWPVPARFSWGAAAAAALLLALLFLPMQQQGMSPLERSYRTVAAYMEPERLQRILQEVPRAEGRLLGFAPDSEAAKVQQAFGAGVRYGRQLLSGNAPEEPRQSQYDVYFKLGQWSVLVWSVAQAEQVLPNSFWREQQQWLAELQKKPGMQQTLPGLDADLARIEKALRRLPDPRPFPVYEQLGYLNGQLLGQLNPE
ncbi:MAG: hypothetical protein GY862_39490 [Gammaproteobacteria bacterium]|nr:hypothetical protein [Gammaproteobacteria bacterium]